METVDKLVDFLVFFHNLDNHQIVGVVVVVVVVELGRTVLVCLVVVLE